MTAVSRVATVEGEAADADGALLCRTTPVQRQPFWTVNDAWADLTQRRQALRRCVP